MCHKWGSRKGLDRRLLIVAAEDSKPAHHSTDSVCAKMYSKRTKNKKKRRACRWGAALIVSLIWMRKHFNKRAIRGREVKGFTFNKHCAKTTLNQERHALKGIFIKCLLMSVRMFYHVSLCVHLPHRRAHTCAYTHTTTRGWFIPSTGQVNWNRSFRLVFSSRSNESTVSRLSKQCAPVS